MGSAPTHRHCPGRQYTHVNNIQQGLLPDKTVLHASCSMPSNENTLVNLQTASANSWKLRQRERLYTMLRVITSAPLLPMKSIPNPRTPFLGAQLSQCKKDLEDPPWAVALAAHFSSAVRVASASGASVEQKLGLRFVFGGSGSRYSQVIGTGYSSSCPGMRCRSILVSCSILQLAHSSA